MARDIMRRRGISYPLDIFRREMGDLFNEFLGEEPSVFRSEFIPSLDVREDENEVVISADLPGMKEDEVDVSIDDGRLTISGERKRESEEEKGNYRRVERSCGRFSRSINLGSAIDKEKAEATFNNGVLTVHVPRKPEAQPRKIKVSKS